MAVKTGKVVIGSKQVVHVLLNENPKLILLSSNCKPNIRDRITYYAHLAKVPCHTVNFTGIELGSICGKPFTISSLAILNPGDSNILDLVGHNG